MNSGVCAGAAQTGNTHRARPPRGAPCCAVLPRAVLFFSLPPFLVIPLARELGSFLKGIKELDEAEKEFRAALRLDPTLAPAHYALGVLQVSDERSESWEEERLLTRVRGHTRRSARSPSHHLPPRERVLESREG